MRIRKLEMQGFKSFADRASFQFGEGISGVVGPNGCGKSNVVDGVKWCIGEQSAKSLRGDSMSDVIFHGSAGRSAVHFAEVTLTFAAGNEPFPGQWQRFSELEVTRRLYRDGGSEYRINQERVRLRDVQDLFMDSGAGNQLYSVIEQGRIGLIVHARPEQRRTLIEEAAGISRYKARREETLQKLESTRGSLERVNDLAEELGRQLRAAERAVQKVVRWRTLQARVRQEDIVVGLVRCAGLIADRKALTEQVRAATGALAQAETEVGRLEADVASRRAALEQLEDESGKVRDRLGELEAQRRVEESAAQYQSRESAQIQDRLGRLGKDQEDARNERDVATAEAESARGRRVAAEGALASARTGADAAAREAQAAGDGERTARGALERARATSLSAYQSAVRARSDVQRAAQRGEELAQRATRNQQATEAAARGGGHLAEEVARLGAQVREAEAAAGESRRRVADLVGEGQRAVEGARREVTHAEASREGATRALREAEAQLTEATRARVALQTRIDALADMLARNVDVPDGLKPALAVPGVLGVLGGVLDVPEATEALLARALDGGLETILVPDVETGARVAAAVKGARARVRVVPPPDADGPVASVADGVRGPPEALRTLAALLGEVEVVDTAGQALAAWRPGVRVVARDGALVRPDGVLLVGQADATAGTAALKRRRDLAVLREQLDGHDASVATRQEAVGAARHALEAAQARVAELQRAVSEAGRAGEAAVEAARAELRGREALVGEARDRLRVQEGEATRQKQAATQLAAEAAQIARDQGVVADEGARAAALVETAEAQHQQAEESAREAQRALEVHEPAARAAAERLAALRTEAGTLQREVASAGETERAATSRAQRAAARVELVAKERTDLEQRLATLTLEASATASNLQSLGEQLGEVRMQLDALRGAIAADREKVRGVEVSAKTARDARDASKDVLHRHEARLSQVRTDLDRVRGDVEARYELSLPALLDRIDRDGQLLLEGHTPPPDAIGGEVVPTLRVTPADLSADVTARAEALREARDAFLKLGEVNLEAEGEYREIAGRHADIEKQRADLLEAMDIIEKAIAKINRTCRERFRETFDLVSEHYSEIYPRLTGGGVGRLQLTDEEDLLVAGVEMFAQPPGKKVQNLALLSGGEKALAAIALIFALFRVKPSPFCLLDEVDAPLDEGNGGRFNEMLKEMSRASQFIIITHNKKTMEAADVLYGVTMPEPGVSRLVTVRMDG